MVIMSMAITAFNKWCYLFLLLVILANLAACNSNQVRHQSNGIPASVYRNSLDSLPRYHHSSQNIENSIFRPDFINLLISINRDEGPLDITRFRTAVYNWNTVVTDRNEAISYKDGHFYNFASLANTDKSSCPLSSDCLIDMNDLIIVQSWLRWQPLASTYHINDDGADPSFEHINNQRSLKLQQALQLIYKNSIGKKLLDHVLKTGLKIELKELQGKHGYYSHADNLIVIDPKVVGYEFNLRYLIHELIHAGNLTANNSITEEVIAEYIGLTVQNQITDIPFEINHYSMFVDHVLHEEYGVLPTNNNIRNQLQALDIRI